MRPDERHECLGSAAAPNLRVQRTRPYASLRGSPLTRRPLGGRLLAVACREQGAKPGPAIVRNPGYRVVRSIMREADSEHTERVELPYAGAGYGFASSSALLDLSVGLGAVTLAGGRTSVGGEAAIWPPTPEASCFLEAWLRRQVLSGHIAEGKLVSAPRIKSSVGGGMPLTASSKSEAGQV